MKYAPYAFPAFKSSRPQVIIIIVSLLIICPAAGCATARPVKLDIQTVLDNPQVHKNKYVEITGYVIDYEPARGDTYRTLYFTLGLEPDEKMPVSAAGYTADALFKASMLVGDAFEAHEPLTATGKLKVRKQDESEGTELRLRTVEYGGTKVDVTRGPKTEPGFGMGGGWRIIPSIGIDATITP